MVVVLPAIVEVPCTRATPDATSIPTVPSRNAPSSQPAAAIASVTTATRSGPAASITARTTAGCTCTPSAINSTVTRGSCSNASAGPGSRWCRGGIALNRWVPTVAPRSTARQTCSYFASVCPTATTTPASTKRRIAHSLPGRSGASVTIRIASPPAASTASISAGSGSRMSVRSCAPQRAGLSHGPSRCMPATTPRRVASASARTPARSSTGAAVTRLASVLVVPCRRWNSAAAPLPCASVYDAPPPPCTCMSTKPGTTTESGNSTVGGPGRPPGPAVSDLPTGHL